MENPQQWEFKHFAMTLESLAKWRTVLKDVLFQRGDFVERGGSAEEDEKKS